MVRIVVEAVKEITWKEYIQIVVTALETRMKMAPAFKVSEREKAILESLAELQLAMTAADDLKTKLDIARDTLKLGERMALADAEGSNAEKRKADAEKFIASDKNHLKLVKAEQVAQAKSEEATRNSVMAGRQLAAQRLGLEAQIALMNFLAGGG